MLLGIGEFEKFFKPFSERGAALGAVARLDAAIGETLKSVLVGDEALITETFSERGQLGAFGGRVRFAKLLGVVSTRIFTELLIINKIRNDFAHKAGANDFENQSIKSKTMNLAIYKEPFFCTTMLQLTNPVEGAERVTAFHADSFKKILLDQGIDISLPRWGFMVEVSLLCSQFEAMTGLSKLRETPVF